MIRAWLTGFTLLWSMLFAGDWFYRLSHWPTLLQTLDWLVPIMVMFPIVLFSGMASERCRAVRCLHAAIVAIMLFVAVVGFFLLMSMLTLFFLTLFVGR